MSVNDLKRKIDENEIENVNKKLAVQNHEKDEIIAGSNLLVLTVRGGGKVGCCRFWNVGAAAFIG